MKDRRTWTWGWALGLSIVLALLMGVESAGKPSKPPPDPPPEVDSGLIWYLLGYNSGDPADYVYWTMEPDGSGKAKIGNTPGHVGQVFQGGYWWSLEYRWNKTDQRDEFWVVREDGNEEFALLLDDGVYVSRSYNVGWAVHDEVVGGKVSVLALRGTPYSGEEPSEHGLQVIYVDWANKTSTPAESLIPVGPYVYVPEEDLYWIRVRYDWSPDGTSLVYRNGSEASLNRVDCDFDTESWSTDDLDTGGDYPQWSPDGTRIAFNSSGGYVTNLGVWLDNLETIAPDGTNRTMLVEASKKVTVSMSRHRWSPSGSHLVYGHRKLGAQPGDSETDIYRITKDGGDATNLTGDLPSSPLVVAWTDESYAD